MRRNDDIARRRVQGVWRFQAKAGAQLRRLKIDLLGQVQRN
jgi:hypothetical protein